MLCDPTLVTVDGVQSPNSSTEFIVDTGCPWSQKPREGRSRTKLSARDVHLWGWYRLAILRVPQAAPLREVTVKG